LVDTISAWPNSSLVCSGLKLKQQAASFLLFRWKKRRWIDDVWKD